MFRTFDPELTYPTSFCSDANAFFVTYDYLTTGEMRNIFEKGVTTPGLSHLAAFGYDVLGNRSSLRLGNGASTSYAYDPISRLDTLAQAFSASASAQSTTFKYNPAFQITGLSKTNGSWAWTGHSSGVTNTAVNGLNQMTFINGVATSHDAKGNLTLDPTDGKVYAYTSENLLKSATGGTSPGAAVSYDPLMRMQQLSNASMTTRFAYDGLDMVAEYNGSNQLQKRYVFGPAIDEPLVEYDASGARTWLTADERGSIVAKSSDSGTVTAINRYDEYGMPQPGNAGRFQYTGQAWVPEFNAYYDKSRVYKPTAGRFLQPDPIGYAGGINLYAYVGNDPVNFVDPLGLTCVAVGSQGCTLTNPDPDIVVIGTRLPGSFGGAGGGRGSGGGLHLQVQRISVDVNEGGVGPQKEEPRKLPPCMQNFLRGRIDSDPGAIRFYDGGSVFNLFDNSVTYGNDIYLTHERFPVGASAWNKFHEIWHTSQNAKFGFNSFDHAGAYLMFGGHDASPLEQAADDFATNTLRAYRDAGLDKTCRF